MEIDQIELKCFDYFDLRPQRLELILTGLNNAANFLQEEELGIDWYGSMNPKKEFESIYRLVFLALEDFIKSSVADRIKEVEKYDKFYKLEPHVELIICLASICHQNSNEKLDTFLLERQCYYI